MENLSQQEIEVCQSAMDEALVYKAQGRYDEALDKFSEIFEAGIVQADIMYQLADTYFAMEDYERAIEWGRNILQRDEQFLQAYWLMALAYYKLDDIKRMLITLEAGLEHGEMGEYQPIFAGILADAKMVNKYQSFILIKCPTVKKVLFGKKLKTAGQDADKAETRVNSSLLKPAVRDESPQHIEDSSSALAAIMDRVRTLDIFDERFINIINSAEKLGHITAADMVILKDMSNDVIMNGLKQCDNIAIRQQYLNMIATGFFAVGVYNRALELLIEADRLGTDVQTLKNLAAVLCQIGETELAVSFLQKIGGTDIMALNLLGQIKNNDNLRK